MSKEQMNGKTQLPGLGNHKPEDPMVVACRQLYLQAQNGEMAAMAVVVIQADGEMIVCDYNKSDIPRNANLPLLNLGIDMLKGRLVQSVLIEAQPAEQVAKKKSNLVL